MSDYPELETIRIEREGHLAEVILNRPEKGNAWNPLMFREQGLAFAALDADPEVRVILLRGEGKNFSFGLDLMAAAMELGPTLMTEGLAGPRQELRELILELQTQMGAPASCRKPVVAAVHGWCIGAGLDAISGCDLRFCSADARFSLREARVAMVADVGVLQRLPKIIGDAATRELAFTAKDISAERAMQLGLVSQVHDSHEELLAAARAEAEGIAKLSPLVTRGVKQVLRALDGQTIEQGLEYVALWNAAFVQSEDLKEAMNAFMLKREPEYTGQ